jgi:Uma2 family endonuclease
LALDERSEPEPDIAVVPGGPRDYRDAHPSHAVLVVEVADVSLAYDRIRKLAAYARAGIPEYWILDLNAENLEVCRRPMGEAYGERRILQAPDRVAPLAGTGDLTVADILP